MENALFLQSDLSNPYDFYKRMRAEQPVFWDKKNQIWAIYSYNEGVQKASSFFMLPIEFWDAGIVECSLNKIGNHF